MTTPTAPATAEFIAPLGSKILFKLGRSCPLPVRVQDGEPVFCVDFRAAIQDRYFLTIKYDDKSCHGISLLVPRIGPAKPRIEKWLKESLPEARLEDWYMQEIERAGGFKGVTGLMTMEAA